MSRRKKRRTAPLNNEAVPETAPVRGFRHWTTTLMFLALIAASIFVYADSLSGPYLFDDVQNISENRHIRVNQPSFQAFYRAARHSPMKTRPVANISFAANYAFFGPNPTGYRVVNLLFHIGTGFVIFALFRTTLRLSDPERDDSTVFTVAFLATALWMLHPTHTQTVAYIVQRMNGMAAFFYLISLYLYIRFRTAASTARKYVFLGSGIVSAALALGSKEIAVTLPLTILLYEWFFLQGLAPAFAKRFVIGTGLVLLLYAVGFLLYTRFDPIGFLSNWYAIRDFTPSERLLTESRVIVFYLTLLLFPHPSRLSLVHDFPVSHSLLDPVTTLMSLLFLAALLAVSIGISRKHRILSFAVIWFFLHLMLESTILPIEIIFDHRLYLPSVFLFLALVSTFFSFFPANRRTILSMVILIAVLFVWTTERAFVFSDDLVFWEDSVKNAPKSPRALNNLGFALANRGAYSEAIPYYRRALSIDPDFHEALNNLGVALDETGNSGEAKGLFIKAISRKPDFYQAYGNLGKLERKKGNVQEAIRLYQKALSFRPDSADLHNNLGVIYAMSGDRKRALKHFRMAIRIDPDHASARSNIQKMMSEK